MQGDYVCFIDDDDWVTENYLECLANKISGHNSVAISNFKDFDEHSGETRDGYLTKAYKSNLGSKENVTILAAHRLFSSSCGKIIPKDIIGKTHFNTAFKNGEDALFMAQISKNIKSIYMSAPDAIYFRRLRSGSASRDTMTKRQIFRNALMQYRQYISIYFSDCRTYSLPFFVNRLLAVTKRTLQLTFRS